MSARIKICAANEAAVFDFKREVLMTATHNSINFSLARAGGKEMLLPPPVNKVSKQIARRNVYGSQALN